MYWRQLLAGIELDSSSYGCIENSPFNSHFLSASLSLSLTIIIKAQIAQVLHKMKADCVCVCFQRKSRPTQVTMSAVLAQGLTSFNTSIEPGLRSSFDDGGLKISGFNAFLRSTMRIKRASNRTKGCEKNKHKRLTNHNNFPTPCTKCIGNIAKSQKPFFNSSSCNYEPQNCTTQPNLTKARFSCNVIYLFLK